jgi:hypothetical protein
LLPEDLDELSDQVQASHHHARALDQGAELRLPRRPAQPLSAERKRRPLSQPGGTMPSDLEGGPANEPSVVPLPTARIRRVRPLRPEEAARGLPASPVDEVDGPATQFIGTPLGLATTGAVVGSLLLLLDRRLLWPLLFAAGAIAGRAFTLRSRALAPASPGAPAAGPAREREIEEDREIDELESRVERLSERA